MPVRTVPSESIQTLPATPAGRRAATAMRRCRIRHPCPWPPADSGSIVRHGRAVGTCELLHVGLRAGELSAIPGAASVLPWAEVLLDTVDPPSGATVLDVASGTGAVARAVARRIGPAGRVLATDISPAMVQFNAGQPAEDGAAPIHTAVASASDLGRTDGEFDLVLCQQGMPFFPDRQAAVLEMRRVLRPGGTVGIAVWAAGHEVMPLSRTSGPIRDAGGAAPYPGAFDESSYVLGPDEVAQMLWTAGFNDVDSREVKLLTSWPSVEAIVAAVDGTPFGPVLAAMTSDQQSMARAGIASAFGEFVRDDVVEVPTWSVIARATA